MTSRMMCSKGRGYSAGNQLNALKREIPGNNSAPPICSKSNPWRRRHQWTESDSHKRIVIIV